MTYYRGCKFLEELLTLEVGMSACHFNMISFIPVLSLSLSLSGELTSRWPTDPPALPGLSYPTAPLSCRLSGVGPHPTSVTGTRKGRNAAWGWGRIRRTRRPDDQLRGRSRASVPCPLTSALPTWTLLGTTEGPTCQSNDDHDHAGLINYVHSFSSSSSFNVKLLLEHKFHVTIVPNIIA